MGSMTLAASMTRTGMSGKHSIFDCPTTTSIEVSFDAVSLFATGGAADWGVVSTKGRAFAGNGMDRVSLDDWMGGNNTEVGAFGGAECFVVSTDSGDGSAGGSALVSLVGVVEGGAPASTAPTSAAPARQALQKASMGPPFFALPNDARAAL